MNEIVFNGVHLAIAIAIAVVAFCAGMVYGRFKAEDEFDEEIYELIGENEALKAGAGQTRCPSEKTMTKPHRRTINESI